MELGVWVGRVRLGAPQSKNMILMPRASFHFAARRDGRALPVNASVCPR
jgi:hypothetical protein